MSALAALASQDHGDARQAVGLLARSAYLAEKAGTRITLAVVDDAAVVAAQHDQGLPGKAEAVECFEDFADG